MVSYKIKLMALEKDIELKCRLAVIKEGGLLIKALPSIIGGLPDRLCILPNKPIFFIEFKRPGYVPCKLQAAVHNILLKLGQAVYTCDSIEQFKVILLKHLKLPSYDFGATNTE